MKYAGVFGLYVGRNMASAAITALALSQRSAAMLIIALAMRMVSEIFDSQYHLSQISLDHV